MEVTGQERALLDIMHRMEKIRLEHLYPELSPAEAKLLGIVSGQEAGITVSALAESMGIPMPAVSRMMRHMEDKGLIIRSILPQDRRSILVTITPVGRQQCEEFFSCQHQFFQELFSAVDPEEFAQMVTTWNRLIDRMEVQLQKLDSGKS